MNDTEQEPIRRMSIYKNSGSRDHKITVYFGSDCDWSDIQRSRNGNKSTDLLFTTLETDQAREYRLEHTRAVSLKYNGKKPCDLNGLIDDMRRLGFDEETIQKIESVTSPCFTN